MKMELASTLRSSSTSPSFPHAFSGNPGGIRTGPRLKHSGVTLLESYLSTPSQIFRTRQGSAVGRISLRLTRSSGKLIFEFLTFVLFAPFVVKTSVAIVGANASLDIYVLYRLSMKPLSSMH